MGMREKEVLQWLRGVGLALLVLQVLVLLLLPWARIAPFHGANGLHADVGILRCIGGALCDISRQTSRGKAPPFLKYAIQGQLRESNLQLASISAGLAIGLSIVCNIGAEAIWSRMAPSRAFDIRVLMQLLSVSLFIFSAVIYMALVSASLDDADSYLSGIWVTLGGGVFTLTVCLFVLTSLNDDEQLLFREKGHYGTLAS